ncbi:hypothetical protein ACVBEH_07355 [Roseateles sp. GG27B]
MLLKAEDSALPLPLTDKLAVRLHLLICKTCPVFIQQLALMRQASQRWRAYSQE